MIQAEDFYAGLEEGGIGFYTGVPDSLMKGFLSFIQEKAKDHVIAANEGAAVALAAGYHLATGKTGLVYLQNSGLGNLVNPLTSMADETVYGIPMLLMIGWRGQPGKKDEPQHLKMGAATTALLEVLGVPVFHFSNDQEWKHLLKEAIQTAAGKQKPVALLIGEGFFADKDLPVTMSHELSAEDLLQQIYPLLQAKDIVVCTTGKIGRLFYKVNGQNGNRIKRYFLNAGAMGHAGSVAAAISAHHTARVILLDGDGSLLMHLGTLSNNATIAGPQFLYLLLNNGAHQSVGGQPTAGFHVDFCSIARACGFELTVQVIDQQQLKQWIGGGMGGKQFVEIRINTKMPERLPRPVENFTEAKSTFMKALKSD
jgi:phosphonopyruvate decarboxylase